MAAGLQKGFLDVDQVKDDLIVHIAKQNPRYKKQTGNQRYVDSSVLIFVQISHPFL